jgi:ABC-type transport system involved in multi-copper enzyme maturation permease subunit
MTILILVGNVLNRLFRSKLLIITLVVAFLIIGLMSSSLVTVKMASAAGELKEAQQAAAGIFIFVTMLMGWFASLVGMVMGVTVTRQDVRDGTIFSVLAKPVARWQYLLGSYLASVIYLLLVWVILAVVYAGLVYLTEQPMGRIHGMVLIGHATLSLLMLSLAFGLAQRFSAWVAALLSLVIYNGDSVMNLITSLFVLMKLRIPEWLSRAMIFPFPATASLDALFESLVRTQLESSSFGWAFLHLLDYSALMLLVGWWLFRRQDLSSATE